MFSDDEIYLRELELLKSTEEGRAKLRELENKDVMLKDSLREYLIMRGRLKDEQEALSARQTLSGKSFEQYDVIQNEQMGLDVRKEDLSEVEKEMFRPLSMGWKIFNKSKNRVTGDPFQKSAQIIADKVGLESLKEDVRRTEMDRFLKSYKPGTFERQDYPADAPLMRHPYDRRHWKSK